jgi:methyltransferase-like protein/predicted O-methyltransferase YrrM
MRTIDPAKIPHKPADNSPTTTTTTSYDEVPYTSHPYRQTHPDRLATVATLLGMTPAKLGGCRVLEIGCSTGGNLLPMAAALPASRFVGIDLSSVEIAEGQQVLGELGLSNVELHHQDIARIDSAFGQFDYIIAHGIYSWIPDQLQSKLLEICSQNLVPGGVAYVSYNTYPGWRMRGTIRDVMCYRARTAGRPMDRLRQARALLDFLSQSVPTDNNAYGILLRDEVTQMQEKEDSYLLHDYLEDINEPVYFYQFIEAAEAHGLQYLGEADYRMMHVSNFPRHVEAMLHSLSSDVVEMEQYMDFLRNRMFRQTLLCRKDVQLDRSLDPARILNMQVASFAKPEAPITHLHSNEAVKFTGPHSTLSTKEPLVKAAMLHLREQWPMSVPFSELFAKARAKLSPEPVVIDTGRATHETLKLAEPLLRCYAIGLAELSMLPCPFTLEVSATPRATPLARYQARQSNAVTNLRHEVTRLNDLQRQVLQHLDGQHTREAILEALVHAASSGAFYIHDSGTTVVDKNRLREILEQSLDQCLIELARMALLCASGSGESQ